ncbi:MAG TPA: hypothetical protein VNR65_07105, partial [Geobacterales bacterium]|nr:hypothetical protein [Geobacterales bacterium]
RVSAAKRLIEFIAATPGAPAAYLSAKTVSDRSIDLLPTSAGVMVQPRQERGVREFTRFRFLSWPVVIAVILAILLIVISLRPTVQANEPHVTSSSNVLL